jgi:hypothetical protein
MRAVALLLLLVAGCAEHEPTPTAAPSASASAPPAFDIDAFCETTLAAGRACAGDDELLEGNKIGLCTTTLRDAGVALDPTLAPACLAAVEQGKPLPDLRTLELLVARFEPCRKLLAPVSSLAKVEARPAGRAASGETCTSSADCAHGLFCDGRDDRRKSCAPQKAAGGPCAKNDECRGRCSVQEGKKCVSYCGSG